MHQEAPRGCRGVRGIGEQSGRLEAVRGVGVSGVHWGLTGSVGTHGSAGYWWH